jgi:glutathione S-transferase
MKLYFDPVSTTSRIVTFFLYDNDLSFDEAIVSVTNGQEHVSTLTKLNPSAQVPVLVDDGGFVLTESSAIIRYLAQKHQLGVYPANVGDRARVDEAVSWLQTNFHVYHCVLLSYTYVIPVLRGLDPQVLAAMRRIGRHGSAKYLRILNDEIIGTKPFICGDDISLADYVGAANVTLGYHCGLDLRPYPNVARWINTLKQRKGWNRAYSVFEALIVEEQKATQDADLLRA